MILSSLHVRPARAFTLVELLVTLVIVAILSSLTLAGLSAARQRAKIDKTKSTIRKIHEFIVPHYENYARRRVPLVGPFASGTALARQRLSRIRTLSLVELPDSWDDVALSGTVTTGTFASLSGPISSYAWSGVARFYGSYRQGLAVTPQYASSECLYMIMATGLGEPDGMSQFRADEMGDIDGDGATELHDGWGNPIMFIRWPFAYRSLIQSQDATTQPDPFDPLRVSDSVPYPHPAANQRDYATTPLIASAGPDGEYGIATGATAWSSFSSFTTIRLMSGTSAPGYETADAADNVTNHQIYAP